MDGSGLAIRYEDQALTYAELRSGASRLASGMLEAGIAPGDRVALFMPNCPELVIAYLACFATGLIAVPLNTRYRAPEVDFALRLAGAQTLMVHEELTAVAAEAATTPKHQWIVGRGIGEWPPQLDRRHRELKPVDAEKPALVLFTSGSTDKPKGVTHTHASMNHTVATQARTQRLAPGDVNLITLATCHVAGLFGQLLPTLRTGGTCLLHARFEPAAVAREIERSKVTRIQLLPAQLGELLDAAVQDGRDLGSLRSAIVGGDVLSPDIHRRFWQLTGLEATEVCGMTECFDYCMNPPFGAKRLGSIGRPPPGTKLRLEGPNGREAPVGDPGEIIVRGAGVMQGYWRDPQHTATVLRDGWLRTGDIARRDPDGWYWFVGRSKEVIIRGGSNVAPGEVEAVLHEHPAVNSAVVVGVPDPSLGQRIAAWVELRPGAVASEQDIAGFVQKRVASYKAPEWIWVEPTLPTNSVGKLDRHLLQRRAVERAQAQKLSGGAIR